MSNLIEEAQQLHIHLNEIEKAKVTRLDAEQVERSHFNSYLRQQVSCIQDMKFNFNIEVTKVRQEMVRLRHDYRAQLNRARRQMFSLDQPTPPAPPPGQVPAGPVAG